MKWKISDFYKMLTEKCNGKNFKNKELALLNNDRGCLSNLIKLWKQKLVCIGKVVYYLRAEKLYE